MPISDWWQLLTNPKLFFSGTTILKPTMNPSNITSNILVSPVQKFHPSMSKLSVSLNTPILPKLLKSMKIPVSDVMMLKILLGVMITKFDSVVKDAARN